MGLLDRHIARRTATNTLLVLAMLVTFVVAIDVFVSLDAYLRAARSVVGADAGPVRVVAFTLLAIIDLWGPRLLQISPQLVGAALIAGVGFTCAQFVRRREFVAMLASGVSLHRLSAPIAVVAVGFVAIVAAGQEFVLPSAAHLLSRGHAQVLQRKLSPFAVPLLADGSGRLFYARAFQPGGQSLRDVLIWERDDRGRVIRRITADAAHWDDGGWRLENGQAERLDAPNRFTPVDSIASDLSPTAITAMRVQGYAEGLSWRALGRALSAGGDVADSRVRRQLRAIGWGRLALLSGMALSTLVALPFFMRREPTTNLMAQSIKAAPLCVGILVGSAVGSAWPAPGLPVWMGVSIAPMIALPVALWAIASIRT